jgi:hypothetical protein
MILPLFISAAFLLRLGFGLYTAPVQPIQDEIQTLLIGLKYFTTRAWPYYGPDIMDPSTVLHLKWLSQDPGALEGLLLGLPMVLWNSPLATFIWINVLSMTAYGLLAWYICKRLPRISPWFVFLWIMAAPWCVHYSTGTLNLSFSIAAATVFFVAWIESFPSMSLQWIPLSRANVLMGFALSVWMQTHRNWILAVPFILLTFHAQWRRSKSFRGILWFLAGFVPLALLIVPTFFQENYHFFRDTTGFSIAFNQDNLRKFPQILLQYLAMACFEMPRFIGRHTADRIQFLTQHWSLWPGFFLWYFGFLQALVLLGSCFEVKDSRPDRRIIRWLAISAFALVFAALLFTAKTPDINTFYEMQPVILIYSFYVWERFWSILWTRRLGWFFVASVWVFQTGYLRSAIPKKESVYLIYRTDLEKAIQEKNYHLFAERREGSLY